MTQTEYAALAAEIDAAEAAISAALARPVLVMQTAGGLWEAWERVGEGSVRIGRRKDAQPSLGALQAFLGA